MQVATLEKFSVRSILVRYHIVKAKLSVVERPEWLTYVWCRVGVAGNLGQQNHHQPPGLAHPHLEGRQEAQALNNKH